MCTGGPWGSLTGETQLGIEKKMGSEWGSVSVGAITEKKGAQSRKPSVECIGTAAFFCSRVCTVEGSRMDPGLGNPPDPGWVIALPQWIQA